MTKGTGAVVVLLLVPLTLFAGYWLAEIVHTDRTRRLPRWGWFLLCVLSIPWGALAYIVLGRTRRHDLRY